MYAMLIYLVLLACLNKNVLLGYFIVLKLPQRLFCNKLRKKMIMNSREFGMKRSWIFVSPMPIIYLERL
jgi:hypothetical protein